MYILHMNTISSTQARQNWADTIEAARIEPVTITDHGRKTVTIMDAELAKLALQVLEDSRDAEEAMAALARIEAGEPTYSLEELASELGINLDEL
jgi:prevent-host-death family protein